MAEERKQTVKANENKERAGAGADQRSRSHLLLSVFPRCRFVSSYLRVAGLKVHQSNSDSGPR